MKFTQRGALLAVAVAAFLFVTAIGCTKYASPDDLQRLEASRQAILAAEKERNQLKDEIAKLEKDIKVKQDSLQAVRDEFQKVKSR